MNKENLIEIIFLIIIFGGLLYIGPGEVFQHKLSHDKPVQFGATDGFLYVMLTSYVADSGNFRNLPEYHAGMPGISTYHPPILMHISAAFSYLSGLPAHDSLALIMALMILFGAFVIYWLIKDFNKGVAFVSAALFVFLYVMNFIIGYVWGEALLHAGTFFLIALFFLVSKPALKHWWVPTGLLIAGTINSHTSETIFWYGFVVFFLAVKWLSGSLTRPELKSWVKNIIFASILAVLISANYLLIFYNGYYSIMGESYTKLNPITPEEFSAIRVPPLQDFHLPVVIAIIAGAVLAVMILRKSAHPVIISCGYMFLVGLTNYIGLSYRAFQTRFFWPIYLAVFFGIPLFFSIKRWSKNTHYLPALVGILLAALIVKAYYQPVHQEGLYDGQWGAFKWLEKNSPEDARVLVFYGDGYGQSLSLLKRMKFEFVPESYEVILKTPPSQNATIVPRIEGEMKMMYRKGIFSFGYHAEDPGIKLGAQPMDVCSFDYYLLDKRTAYAPQLAQANIAIANTFLLHNMTLAYQNDQSIIIRNNDERGVCLA
jgi:hypothetical protein